MTTKLQDIPKLLFTPLGRLRLRGSILRKLWPFLRFIAILYRRTFIRHTRVTVVVGSFGKTTATRALSTVLGAKYFKGGNAFESVVGAILSIRPGAEYAVIEVGIDGPGQMAAYVDMLRPDITVVTSIGSEHNRSLGSIETTRNEKAIMVRCLESSALAILNGDDPNVIWMRDQTKARVITYGLNESNDIRGLDISLSIWPNGTSFTVLANSQSNNISTRLIGQPNVYAVLAAITVAFNEGISLSEINQRLGNLAPTQGRLDPVMLDNGAIILRDDIKSPLETVLKALEVISRIPAKRKIVVFGRITEPIGSQGDAYRYIGTQIATVADRLILMCGKRDSSCRAGAIQAGMPENSIIKADGSYQKVIEILKHELVSGDVVLIKGAGTQKLERITLALLGRNTKCPLRHCKINGLACEDCPNLEKEHDIFV